MTNRAHYHITAHYRFYQLIAIPHARTRTRLRLTGKRGNAR